MQLHGRGCRAGAAAADQERVRRPAPEGDGALLVDPAHRRPGRAVGDQPLRPCRPARRPRARAGTRLRRARRRAGQGAPSPGAVSSVSHSSIPSAATSAAMAGAAGCPARHSRRAARRRRAPRSRGSSAGPGQGRPLGAERPDRDVCRLPEHGEEPGPRRPAAMPACSAGSIGDPPVGHVAEGDGPGRPGLTISAAQRWTRPTWVASCGGVQSGQRVPAG